MRALPRLLLSAVLAVAALPLTAAAADTTYRFSFDGRARSYIVSRPASCRADCPLMVDLHPFLGSASGERSESGQKQKAAEEGYIVVYPQGVQRSWAAGSGPYGSCCGWAEAKKIDDVGFVREVVRRVSAAYPVDRGRVYVTGFSNGCALTQRLAAEASDVFAAAACTSLYLLTTEASLPRPIPVTEIHGVDDTTASYQESKSFTGAVNNLQRWAALNGCVGAPVRTPLAGGSTLDTYTDCAGGVQVQLASLANTGHDTYANRLGIDIAQLVWDSVKNYRLP